VAHMGGGDVVHRTMRRQPSAERPIIAAHGRCRDGVSTFHGFTTRFESRGAHGCEEQWYAMDTRV
jgi:hypothetical protein